MKTDTYTKTVLTVIAICLSIIALKEVNIFPAAHAATAEKKIEPNKNYSLVPLNEDGSINVRLNHGEFVDVRLRAIDWSPSLGGWETINVRVNR